VLPQCLQIQPLKGADATCAAATICILCRMAGERMQPDGFHDYFHQSINRTRCRAPCHHGPQLLFVLSHKPIQQERCVTPVTSMEKHAAASCQQPAAPHLMASMCLRWIRPSWLCSSTRPYRADALQYSSAVRAGLGRGEVAAHQRLPQSSRSLLVLLLLLPLVVSSTAPSSAARSGNGGKTVGNATAATVGRGASLGVRLCHLHVPVQGCTC